MTEIKNETGTKKKLLIPVVVLMLLAVGLTGAAYAYNSSLTLPNQQVDAADLTLDLRTPAAADIEIDADDLIVFTDNYSYTAVPSTKTNRVDAYANDGNIWFKLKVTGEGVANQLKVSSSNIGTFLGTTLGNGVTIGDLFDVKINTSNSGTDAVAITANNTPVAIEITKAASATANVDLYVLFFAKDSNAHTVQTALAPGSGGYKDAAAFKTAFETAGLLNFSFVADSEAPASP